jgi:transcriptional regulator with XRE-family HTH domain
MKKMTPQDARKYIGKRVYKERMRMDLSQRELARTAGLESGFAVSQIENGLYVCERTIKLVCSKVGLSFVQLLADFANEMVKSELRPYYDAVRPLFETPQIQP